MSGVWEKVRTRAGLAVVGGALVAVGVGVGSAAALSSPGTAPASDEIVVTTPAATSSSEPAPTSEATQPAPTVQDQGQAAPTSSVAAVTTPKSEPKAQPSPDGAMTLPSGVVPVDPNDVARGGHDAAGNWVPAGPPSRPGQPPYVGSAPVEQVAPLPGETGYNG